MPFVLAAYNQAYRVLSSGERAYMLMIMLWHCPGQSGENSSEGSTTLMNKSSDATIETSVTHAKGNGDKAGASMQTVTSDTDASKGRTFTGL